MDSNFQEAKLKAIINEIDVEERLINFPTEWLYNVDWVSSPMNYGDFSKLIRLLADDFLFGKDNSLCAKGSVPIKEAQLLSL